MSDYYPDCLGHYIKRSEEGFEECHGEFNDSGDFKCSFTSDCSKIRYVSEKLNIPVQELFGFFNVQQILTMKKSELKPLNPYDNVRQTKRMSLTRESWESVTQATYGMFSKVAEILEVNLRLEKKGAAPPDLFINPYNCDQRRISLLEYRKGWHNTLISTVWMRPKTSSIRVFFTVPKEDMLANRDIVNYLDSYNLFPYTNRNLKCSIKDVELKDVHRIAELIAYLCKTGMADYLGSEGVKKQIEKEKLDRKERFRGRKPRVKKPYEETVFGKEMIRREVNREKRRSLKFEQELAKEKEKAKIAEIKAKERAKAEKRDKKERAKRKEKIKIAQIKAKMKERERARRAREKASEKERIKKIKAKAKERAKARMERLEAKAEEVAEERRRRQEEEKRMEEIEGEEE